MSQPQVDLDDLDLFTRGVPHAALAELRRRDPVRWVERGAEPGYWVVTRYAELVAINRDWQRFSSTSGVTPRGQGVEQSFALLNMDPPEHTRARALVSPAFTPRAIGRLEARVRQLASERAFAFVRAGGGEFVAAVAAPYPVRVICELIGVPEADERDILAWSNAVVPNRDPEYSVSTEVAAEANRKLEVWARGLIEHKRSTPGEDLCSELLRVRLDDRPLSDEQISAFVRLIVVGGSETTRHLLSHALLLLAQHPEQRERFASGEVPAETAVEELLRFVSPVLHHGRRATQDVEVAGRKIRAGDRVTLWMVSANRDDAVFERPDQLDLGRRPNEHVALGAGGPHFCLGAHLARLETVALLDALRPWLSRIELAGEPVRLRSNFFHGIKRLPLAVRA
jgi:cholest-4-en-3-one 26-monooxygenase